MVLTPVSQRMLNSRQKNEKLASSLVIKTKDIRVKKSRGTILYFKSGAVKQWAVVQAAGATVNPGG
jgi:hypothetical protein